MYPNRDGYSHYCYLRPWARCFPCLRPNRVAKARIPWRHPGVRGWIFGVRTILSTTVVDNFALSDGRSGVIAAVVSIEGDCRDVAPLWAQSERSQDSRHARRRVVGDVAGDPLRHRESHVIAHRDHRRRESDAASSLERATVESVARR